MKIGPVVIVATVLCGSTAYVVAQSPAAAKRIATAYVPAKTAWGDPSLAGVYTNNDESLIPFERPAQFEGRRLEDITETELEQLRDQRSDDPRRSGSEPGRVPESDSLVREPLPG